jgi:hypothetical protein
MPKGDIELYRKEGNLVLDLTVERGYQIAVAIIVGNHTA